MLLDLSEKLQKVLANYKVQLTEKQIKNLCETLEWYKGGIIPATVIRRELNISFEDTHKLMIYLMTKGILKSKYRIYCENDTISGVRKVYDDPAEIPMIICDRCDKGCSLIKNLVVEFEVCI